METNTLTTLIFSKDKFQAVAELVGSVYRFSNQTVIVYSGSAKDTDKLRRLAKDGGFGRIEVHYVAPLGHPEPAQMYGLGKCRGEWIFYIDTDERPSELLKSNIRRIISDAKCDAFLVAKREMGRGGRRLLTTHQRRLFRRKSAVYSGYVFSDPRIIGKEEYLDSGYHIVHSFDYNWNRAKVANYNVIKAYEYRETYGNLLGFMKPMIANLLIKGYCRFKRVDVHSELSRFDYIVLHGLAYYLIGELAICLKKRRPPNVRFIFGNLLMHWGYVSYICGFTEQERRLQSAIAGGIRSAGGVIKYLGVDGRYIERINKSHRRTGIGGTELFVSELVKRHCNSG